ncbi:MAG: hypothetical protein EXR75_07665 [Myxococcales bacterium]|nr:hypothetical protein [Myxococcales bacterium]
MSWNQFRAAAAIAAGAGETQAREDADRRMAALEPKVAHISVHVDQPPPGLELMHNEQRLDSAAWFLPFVVDFGHQRFRARAPGRRDWTRTVDVRAPGTIVVTVPLLEFVATSAASGPGLGASGALLPTGLPPTGLPANSGITGITGAAGFPERSDTARLGPVSDSPPLGTQRTVALVFAGVGVAGFLAGAVTGAAAIVKWNEAMSRHCDPALRCDSEGVDLANQATIIAHASTASLAIAGVAAVSSVALWFSAPVPSGSPLVGTAKMGISPSGLQLGLEFH